jgi:hypothetical protein
MDVCVPHGLHTTRATMLEGEVGDYSTRQVLMCSLLQGRLELTKEILAKVVWGSVKSISKDMHIFA